MRRTLIFSSSKAHKNLVSFFKKHPELRERTRDVLVHLLENPLDRKVGAHKLTGVLGHFYGADITPYKYRIVYAFDDRHVYVLNIGTHEEAY